jgi:hypothetical protein
MCSYDYEHEKMRCNKRKVKLADEHGRRWGYMRVPPRSTKIQGERVARLTYQEKKFQGRRPSPIV